MHFIKIFLFLISALLILDGYAKELDLAKADSINDLAWEKMYSDPELSKKLAEDVYKMYAAAEYKRGLIKTFYLKGYIDQSLHYYDLAAKHYFNGLELVRTYDGENSQLYEMLLLQNLGNLYSFTFNYKMATEYYQSALSIAKQMNYQNDQSVLSYNLGVVCEKHEKYEEAEAHYLQALQVTPESNHEHLASIHNSIGNVYNKTEFFDKAKTHYLKAIAYQEKTNKQKDLAFYISNLGENLFKQGHVGEAIEYYNEALNLSIRLEDIPKVKFLRNNLGDAYLAQNNYEKAIDQFEKAIALGNNEVLDPQFQRACKSAATAYQKIGKYQDALALQNKLIGQSELLDDTREMLLAQNAQYQMKEVEWLIERQAKEAMLSHMKAANFWFKVSMTLLFLILAGASYKAYRYYKGIRLVKKWLATEV